MSKSQIENCVQRLSSNLVKGDEEKRDIAATSLKIIIAKVPADIAQGPIQNCMDALVEALKVLDQQFTKRCINTKYREIMSMLKEMHSIFWKKF